MTCSVPPMSIGLHKNVKNFCWMLDWLWFSRFYFFFIGFMWRIVPGYVFIKDSHRSCWAFVEMLKCCDRKFCSIKPSSKINMDTTMRPTIPIMNATTKKMIPNSYQILYSEWKIFHGNPVKSLYFRNRIVPPLLRKPN